MGAAFWLSYALLWALALLLALLVLLLYRQVGTLLLEGEGAGAAGGLPPGAQAPPLELALDGGSGTQRLAWAGGEPAGGWLLLFTGAGCGACEGLAREVAGLPAAWPSVRFLWVAQEASGGAPAGWRLARSPDRSAFHAMEVPATPFAYALAPGGTVAARRHVTGAADLHALLRSAFRDPAGAPAATTPAP